MKQLDGTALLITIAEDLSHEPILKVWALDKTEKKTGAPKCLSTLNIQNGRKPFPVSYKDQGSGSISVLMDVDICICNSRESITARGRFRKRGCHCHKRGFDK